MERARPGDAVQTLGCPTTKPNLAPNGHSAEAEGHRVSTCCPAPSQVASGLHACGDLGLNLSSLLPLPQPPPCDLGRAPSPSSV